MKHKIIGTFLAAHGDCVFEPDDQQYDDMVLPNNLMTGQLVDGDRIQVGISSQNNEAVSIKLLERKREVIGIVDARGRIKPLHEIGVDFIVASNTAKATRDEIVLVKLLAIQEPTQVVSGEIVEHLDHHTDSRLEAEIVLRAFNIPTIWDKKVLAEAQKSATEKSIAEESKKREDLRNSCFVTIDGEDAKDFDDAIHCTKTDQGWRISVAIADVASYVATDSALDKEAFKRGNSVYLPGNVVPMLPAVLSDQVCSLRPQEDKLVLVCHFDLSKQGDITHHDFTGGVIRSQARLTYNEVKQFLADGKLSSNHSGKVAANVSKMLREAYRAYRVLLQRRSERGALDIDTVEKLLLFDKTGAVRGIIPNTRNEAHCLIEEFMICANICAARFLISHDKDFLYRIHAGLKKDAVRNLKIFLNKRGINFNDANGRVRLAEILQEAKEREDSDMIQTAVLHSLSRALYQPENIGHYGLALEEYAHFTSPIRRYPDLVVHRAIHSVLNSKSGTDYAEKRLEEIGTDCSMTERRADDAVHDIEKYLKCVYAEQYIGRTFSGVIMSVTSFGLFIELKDIYIEGLLHISGLVSDYYIYDEINRCLTGEKTGKTYQQGDKLSVVLAQADADTRRIDLILPEGQNKHQQRRRRGWIVR